MSNTYVKSPLNYTGGKFKLISQIIPLFPQQLNTFVDLFGGGFNVGINVEADNIIYNDLSPQVMQMLKYFKENNLEDMLKQIENWIDEYKLSKTNQEGFLEFRLFYNNNKNPLALYTLICYAFNYQIRFNKASDYNMSFGKDRSSFNDILKNKFINFVKTLQSKNINFINNDFISVLKNIELNSNVFIYCDPPYFNSTATYNENGGWTGKNELELRELLIKLHDKKISWALSNNLSTNESLEKWANDNEFKINYLNGTYGNCNYHKKDKSNKDIEVLITNY